MTLKDASIVIVGGSSGIGLAPTGVVLPADGGHALI
jgi:NAD(P)-dependent dehydrogenase (short-subunit alcohol dehydrogenase family)